MKTETLNLVCCPSCRNTLMLHEYQLVGNDIVDGLLVCTSCGKSFSIIDGVPQMIIDMGNRKDLIERWGYEWAKVFNGNLEIDTYYGETEEEEEANFFRYFDLSPEDLYGKKVLDAGCGCGRLTKALGKYGAQVVGIDISSSIGRVHNYCQSEPNVAIIQADLETPPFPDAAFDYVSCKLSLCYMPNPEKTFMTISRLVKPGGRLFVSMPNKADLAFTVRLKDILRITHRVPKQLLFSLCYTIAPLLWMARKISTKRNDSLRTNVFLLFNAWHSQFSYHTWEEVVSWFRKDNFDQITKVQGITHSVSVRGEKSI